MREDIEKLMAIHDGEASGVDGAEADKQSLDVESQEFLARLKAADTAFAAAADELLDAPVPSKLVDAIRKPQSQTSSQARADAEPAVSLQAESESQKEPQSPQSAEIIPFPRRRKAVVSFALAAGLVAVVATNTELFRPPAGPALNFESADQRALFQNAMSLAASGDMQQSADGSMSIMPVASFVTEGDAFCREFMALQGETEFAGIACHRTAGSWELRSAQKMGVTPDGDVYQAASGEDAGIALPSDITRAAELSYAEEQAAIRSGWRD